MDASSACHVYTFANTAAVAKEYDWAGFARAEEACTILMVAAAGIIAAAATDYSCGNVGYALTVAWAMAGIVVANLRPGESLPVAVTAGAVGAAVTLALLYARLAAPRLA
jgi:hypothetical protein